MTANKTIGQGKNGKRTWVLTLAVLAAGLATSLSAAAANVLQDVRYASAPGGKVDITLQFAEPVGDVQAFTTDTPPRIAVDIAMRWASSPRAAVRNTLKNRLISMG